jgi:transposase
MTADYSDADLWARLRFAVVGSLIAAPPIAGELRPALQKLASKSWRHPVSGLDVRFGASTIERWFYRARKEANPAIALKNRERCTRGKFPSVSTSFEEILKNQSCAHPSWTVQQHFDHLRNAPAVSGMTVPSYPTIRRYLKAHNMSPRNAHDNPLPIDAANRWNEWTKSLMMGFVPEVPGSTLVDRTVLVRNLFGRCFLRKKAIVILANEQGFTNKQICKFLGVSSSTVFINLKKFRLGGVDCLFRRKVRSLKEDDAELKTALFCLLHEPPSLSGLNRTTWKKADMKKVLKERGFPVCLSVIRKIIKNAGFRWKMARVVLTSSDPKYREKLNHVHEVLANLTETERFFSIDEYGPFAIKMRGGGRLLVPPGTQPTIPQWQKSKGWIIMTAALELSTNQLTHFYSAAKNTDEMIRMAKTLVSDSRGITKIYLSWDAASWHMSKKLTEFIEAHNKTASANLQPDIALAPLPAGAQFLNVIESVFSGMARAIIHNSNYASPAEVMTAINRYVIDRNDYFIANPKRAGNKIWGMERSKSEFDASNNCKDPRYR